MRAYQGFPFKSGLDKLDDKRRAADMMAVLKGQKPSGEKVIQVSDIEGLNSSLSDIRDLLDTKVPKTTEVNGHPLNTDVDVTKSDVGLGNVLNIAQMPATTLTLTMYRDSGEIGTSVGPRGVAPRAGVFTKSKIIVDASDASTDLTFTIKQNGTTIFTATVPQGATVGTLQQSTFAAVSVAENDVFTLDITSGTSAWKFTAQLG